MYANIDKIGSLKYGSNALCIEHSTRTNLSIKTHLLTLNTKV